jgi:hypothetical protein
MVVLVIGSILSLLFVSCMQATGPDFGGAEFTGAWVYDMGFTTETLTITTTAFAFQQNGNILGTMECSITSYDENANHIEMSTTSVTGIYTIYSEGTDWYLTYSVSGNEIYLDMDTTGYPASARYGPYIKQ